MSNTAMTDLAKTAKAAGERYFYPGILCKNGNISKRLVSARICCCSECRADRTIKSRKWNEANPEKCATKLRAWRASNADAQMVHRRTMQGKYKAGLAERPKEKQGRPTFRSALRRKAVIQATPPWVNREDLWLVYHAAAERRKRGEDVHVDHVMPIKGKASCGLHVPWNLQILPAKENLEKFNKEPVSKFDAAAMNWLWDRWMADRRAVIEGGCAVEARP